MGVERTDFYKELYKEEQRADVRALKFAGILLDEKGNLKKEWEDPSYLAPPDGFSDHLVTDHFRAILAFLKTNKHALSPYSLPVCGQWIEDVICITLKIPAGSKITVRDVRLAVLTSLLTPLRQSIGSCFATAPAILIQQEQPENFLSDLMQLMTRGKLSRVFEGVE